MLHAASLQCLVRRLASAGGPLERATRHRARVPPGRSGRFLQPLRDPSCASVVRRVRLRRHHRARAALLDVPGFRGPALLEVPAGTWRCRSSAVWVGMRCFKDRPCSRSYLGGGIGGLASAVRSRPSSDPMDRPSSRSQPGRGAASRALRCLPQASRSAWTGRRDGIGDAACADRLPDLSQDPAVGPGSVGIA